MLVSLPLRRAGKLLAILVIFIDLGLESLHLGVRHVDADLSSTLHVEAILGQIRFAAAVLGRWLIGRRLQGCGYRREGDETTALLLAPAPKRTGKRRREAAKGSRRHGVELWSRSPAKGVGCGMVCRGKRDSGG